MATDTRYQCLSSAANFAAIVTAPTDLVSVPTLDIGFKSLPKPGTKPPPPHSCAQTLSLSFFFDGTGNNLDADVGTWEHSNVARLYRSHVLDDDGKGIYSFYLPGIGTLFKDREVNDPGDTLTGKAFGAQGQDRLTWAMARLNEKLKVAEARATNLNNPVCWVKVAVFGFSRGAALARAFCLDLQKRCERHPDSPTGWRLMVGRHPVEISFLGIFDTVASAGLPPSANNSGRNHYLQAVAKALSPATAAMDFDADELRGLAFGSAPGADPAAGPANGHAAWANDLHVAEMVKRCCHLVSGHEMRNSFALDSALYEQRPAHFTYPASTTELVFPGVHSDVGGGYRPGEGGCCTEAGAQLSLVPLHVMHAEAVKHVPLRQLVALEGDDRKDFGIDPASTRHLAHTFDLVRAYFAAHATVAVPNGVAGLGRDVNRHMRLYFAWRFHAIRAGKARRATGQAMPQEQRIQAHEAQFAKDRAALADEKKAATRALYQAQREQEHARLALESAQMNRARYGHTLAPALAQRHEEAKHNTELKQIALDRVLARQATAANDSELSSAMAKYDAKLLADARCLSDWMKQDKSLKPRPHYAALVEAYRNEYERNAGLHAERDAKLIEFFDLYVHDSLSAFDKDETWPSDPRILYVGGDRKLRYADRQNLGQSTTEVA